MPGLDLGASWNVGLVYWDDSTNGIDFRDSAGWAIYGKRAAAADITMIDRETRVDQPAERAQIAHEVRAANGGKPVMFYGTGGWIGQAGMNQWAYLNPTSAERALLAAESMKQADWIETAGAVAIYAQVMRPTEQTTIERLIHRQFECASHASLTARKILFIQDTWNWSQMGFPAIGEGMCRKMLDCAKSLEMDVCIFQPVAIDAKYPWRPLWDVIGDYIPCVLDRAEAPR
jgi:hypothetical protein